MAMKALFFEGVHEDAVATFSRAGYGAIVQDEPGFVADVDSFAGGSAVSSTTKPGTS